jgi:hypothetical protein
MIEDEILQGFLDKSASRAMDEIKKEGRLSEQNAIPLLLKAQFNHIAHLDVELTGIRTDFTSELVAIRKDFTSELAAIRTDFTQLRKDVALDMAQLRKDVALDMDRFRKEITQMIHAVDSKLNWFMVLITLIVCIVLPVILEFLKR